MARPARQAAAVEQQGTARAVRVFEEAVTAVTVAPVARTAPYQPRLLRRSR